MRCLVLGGSSFVGGRLVERLLAEGHETAVLNRGRTGSPRPGVTQLIADRRDPATIRAALSHGYWDAVFDVSGYIMATDAENFLALLDLLDGRAGRYVFVSSVMAYAPSGYFPWPETAPVTPDPPTTYGGFKAFAEQAMLERFAASGFARDGCSTGGDLRPGEQHLRHGIGDVPSAAPRAADPAAASGARRELLRSRGRSWRRRCW